MRLDPAGGRAEPGVRPLGSERSAGIGAERSGLVLGSLSQQATDAYVAHMVQEVLGPIAHVDQRERKCIGSAQLPVVLFQEGELASNHCEGRRCALH